VSNFPCPRNPPLPLLRLLGTGRLPVWIFAMLGHWWAKAAALRGLS
jgi:hypothetical protein